MGRHERYFVRNDETGLIETWSLPYCIIESRRKRGEL
jgi:hypothetical protein